MGLVSKGRVVFATPSLSGPTASYMEALKASIPPILEAGWDAGYAQEIGCPYISNARGTMTRKALDSKADVIVYIDYDLSWDPQDLLTLIETPGDVVAGLYRFKEEIEHYMGVMTVSNGPPEVRNDGCIKASRVPAGFLKVTKECIDKFMSAYPDLIYGPQYNPSIDLFNHGAYKRQWWGEDYAFSRRWVDCGGEIWVVPNINLNHHSTDQVFKGNFHNFMLRQPSGSESANSDSRNGSIAAE